jgi:hypothetical protein
MPQDGGQSLLLQIGGGDMMGYHKRIIMQSSWANAYKRKRSTREMVAAILILLAVIILMGIAGEMDYKAQFGDTKTNNELRHQVLQRVVEVGR